MVVNLRGTSGSGKTTAVRALMNQGTEILPLEGTPAKPHAYRVNGPLSFYVIGSYENVCGGCDSISTQDEICNRIRTYAPQGHVLVEGLLMSHLFSRYAKLDRELHARGIPFIWAFLDTPLDVCIQRVEARREERRLAKKVVPEFKPLDVTNTTDKWHDMRRVFDKCVKPNDKDWKKVGEPKTVLDARWVPYLSAPETIASWL